VNARKAPKLDPTAYIFYRPLPDKKLKTLDLLKFALRGHFKELIVILLTGIVTTVLGMLTPTATAILMDNAIPDAKRELLVQIALGSVGCCLGGSYLSTHPRRLPSSGWKPSQTPPLKRRCGIGC
jgi:ABC-type bacteriocin/lantibiotic exporter with double-glycine peptidase domain